MNQFTPTFNATDLQVFAEMVQREKLARKVYLNKLKAPKEEKFEALKAMKQEENNVDSMLYAILNPRPQRQPAYANRRY